MAFSFVHNAQIPRCLDRIAAGDRAARDELFQAVNGRLFRLARKMCHRFPRLRRWADAGDVVQNARLRLLRALEVVCPDSERAFFALAAEQIRRELLDLARHYFGPQGVGAHRDRRPLDPTTPEPSEDDALGMEEWQAFQQQVALLPAEEREVVHRIFYGGQTQAEAAEVIGVSVRTVKRRWQAALRKLRDRLSGA